MTDYSTPADDSLSVGEGEALPVDRVVDERFRSSCLRLRWMLHGRSFFP